MGWGQQRTFEPKVRSLQNLERQTGEAQTINVYFVSVLWAG